MKKLVSSKISRRRFLKWTGAAALAAGAAPYLNRVRAQGGTLRILQWSHFIPAYDTWFDEYAMQWGEANGVQVVVDHVNLADLPATVAAEISAGSGHDLIEFVGAEAGQFEPSLVDLSDINQEAQSNHGDQLDVGRRYSYNPVTDKYYGFLHSWTIDPGNYRRSLWEAAGKADGPETWEDLVTYGGQIRADQGVPMGIGLAQEIDSNMAHRSLLYSFDATLQDEEGNVILDQGENFERARAAVDLMMRMYEAAMTPEVFAWNAASNNQTLVAGRSSFIINSISAYRSAQKDRPDIARDVFFTPALAGPGGTALNNAHVIYNYAIPEHSPNVDTAKQFILDLAANEDQVMYNSELYMTPSFFNTAIPEGDRGYEAVSGASTVEDLHNAWFENDPFKLPDEEDGKLLALRDGVEWTTNVGHPGVTNPAIAEVFNTFIVPNMMARAVRGEQSPEESIRRAAEESRQVFQAWRDRGLI